MASPSGDPAGVTSIAAARAAAKNARFTVRGVVTLPPGIVDGQTAVIQDVSGAIVLRLGEEVGRLSLGERVEVDGIGPRRAGWKRYVSRSPPSTSAQAPCPRRAPSDPGTPARRTRRRS